jgi:HAD superfamily hydrolase (TIGR01509 family)
MMTEESLSAVLWDMDGTLIDTEPLWIAAEHAMLARFGIEMTPDIPAKLIGSGLHDAAQLFRDLGVPLGLDEIISEWLDGVTTGLQKSRPTWRPGALDLLASLREAKIPCALVTMSFRSFADVVVAMLPADSFTAIVTGDSVTHEKPHPEPYLLGAAALGVPITQCVALEDSPTGLRSAVSSGAVALGIPNILSLGTAPAHAVLPTLEGLHAAALAEQFARLRVLDARPGVSPEQRGVDH